MRLPSLCTCALAAILIGCEWDNSGFPAEDPETGPKVESPVDSTKPLSISEPQFSGCWRTVFEGDSGRIRAWQKGKAVGGFLTWDGGGADTLGGSLGFPYLRLEARGAHGPRVYLGNVLRTVRHFETKLLDTPNRRIEKLNGDRVPCGADTLMAP